MSVSNDEQLIEFNVTNMGGYATAYKVNSIEELRVRIAMQAEILSPCILLFKASDNRMVEDTDEEPLTVLRSVNNLQRVKQEVGNWASEKWIHVSKLHLRYGDQNFIEHAGPLISADERFHNKMHQCVRGMIHPQEATAEDVKAAIALGIDIMSVRGDLERTLLHAAAMYDHVEPLNTLLNARVGDVNIRSAFEYTPFICAANGRHVEALRSLLNAGADPSLVDNNGWAPIHVAAADGHVEVITLLIEAGVDVNVTDEQGRTPLHEASQWGHAEIIRILMEAGANEDAKDENGKTSYGWASNEECKRALQGQ